MVILLAGAALWLKGYVSQDTLQHGISTVGSLALIGVGGWQVLGAVSSIRHGHSHGHSHAHAEHLPHNFRGVFILGLSNGVLPCPGALAALLVAISMEKIGLGLMTVLVYSLGLALALTGICLVVLEAGKKARTWLPSDTALLWLPLGSGVLVMGTGLWMLKIFG
jgi:nickel/cobalt transporter (NicO) family protein